MFPCCHVQGTVRLFARSLKRRWYQQMSGAGDCPAERDERLACHRVCGGERGREALVESVATCQTSSSIWVLKLLMSTPDGRYTGDTGRRRDFRYFICQLGHIV
jgi:hypothetical protein